MKTSASRWQKLLQSPEYTALLLAGGILCFIYPIFASPSTLLSTLLSLFIPWGLIIALLTIGQRQQKNSASATETVAREEDKHA